MKIVFLAGSFRGNDITDIKQNIENAKKYVNIFIENEIPFYSPHLNINQEIKNFPTNKTEYASKLNHAFLNLCDALAVLPEWEKSSGTKKEIEEAKKSQKPIFYLEDKDAITKIISFLKD
ncbi:MAG: hypothetical protein UZ19_OD1000334 [Parcubacteria bacterium OLB19]|nr:MAG: hypothetical protein UZ19_OD1000334 [Parcubacteria bacterium OLB19]